MFQDIKKRGQEMLFETQEGFKIIGIEVEPSNEFFTRELGLSKEVAKKSFDGVWILRTRLNRITFLSHDQILRIRKITLFDKEYDPKLGI